MKMARVLCLVVAFSAARLFAAASVTGVSWSQDADTRLVTVNYTLLGGPAIVTVDVATNGPNGWASIGGENVSGGRLPSVPPWGDVNRRIVGDGAKQIFWRPDRAWPGHRILPSNARFEVRAWNLDDPPDYMVVNLLSNITDRLTFYTGPEWLPGGILSNYVYRLTSMPMRRIRAGGVTWTMGSTSPAPYTRTDVSPKLYVAEIPHSVTLPADYYIGVFELTQKQFEMIRTDTSGGSYFTDYNSHDGMLRPVESSINYWFLREYTRDVFVASGNKVPKNEDERYQYPSNPSPESAIGNLRTMTGLKFDLPSEAQWEFAARGLHGEGYWGDGTPVTISSEDDYQNDPGLLARYGYTGATPAQSTTSAAGGTARVGSYPPNSFGLYDMDGNVSEWCLDWAFNDNTKQLIEAYTALNGAVNANGKYLADGTTVGQYRVRRGGNFTSPAVCCRPAYRASTSSVAPFVRNTTGVGTGIDTGARLCCPATLVQEEE